MIRGTTHTLADSLSERPDSPNRGFTLGRFTVLWDDKGKHPAMSRISTEELFPGVADYLDSTTQDKH